MDPFSDSRAPVFLLAIIGLPGEAYTVVYIYRTVSSWLRRVVPGGGGALCREGVANPLDMGGTAAHF